MIELEKLANMVDHTLLKADATKKGFDKFVFSISLHDS